MQELNRVAERVMTVWYKATVSADDYYVDAVGE